MPKSPERRPERSNEALDSCVSSLFDLEEARQKAELQHSLPNRIMARAIEEAKKRGERIIEVEVPVTVRIPEGFLLSRGLELNLENVVDASLGELYVNAVVAIKETASDVVDSGAVYNSDLIELEGMSCLRNGRQTKTDSFDLERADELLDEMAEIEQKIKRTTAETDHLRKFYHGSFERAIEE